MLMSRFLLKQLQEKMMLFPQTGSGKQQEENLQHRQNLDFLVRIKDGKTWKSKKYVFFNGVTPLCFVSELILELSHSSAFSSAREQSLCTSPATESLLTIPRAILADTPFTGPTSVSNFAFASSTILCNSLNREVPSNSL